MTRGCGGGGGDTICRRLIDAPFAKNESVDNAKATRDVRATPTSL